MDDLFGNLPPDPGPEPILCKGRRYRLKADSMGGIMVTWAGIGAQGVIGGTYANDAAALAAIDVIESKRAAT